MKRLKTSWDGDFEKCDQGPQSNLFRYGLLPSDFNVEVKGAYVNVVKLFRNEIQDNKLKFYTVSFEAFNLEVEDIKFQSKKINVPRCLYSFDMM